MWLMVFFDLPTEKKIDRKRYAIFRKKLMVDGFTMMQYSVYTRHCPSRENAEVHIRRVERILPKEGQVSIMMITDRQYSGIINYLGKRQEELPPAPQQLELF